MASRPSLPWGHFTPHARRPTPQVILLIVLLLLLLPLLWFLLAPGDDGTLAEIRQRGVLRVGLDASFPPFETIDPQGQIIGLDVDIARAVAQDLGVELELVNIGFDGLYDALLARRVDLVISGLPYDPRWTQDVAYSRNYFNAGQVLLARADDSGLNDVADLAGRTVAVEWGSQAEMEARRLSRERAQEGAAVSQTVEPSFSLLRQETASAALEALRQGQAGAAIVDAPSALAVLAPSLPEGEDFRRVAYLTDEWYAAAVHRQSRELLAAVNQTLARLEESGEITRLQAHWFGGG